MTSTDLVSAADLKALAPQDQEAGITQYLIGARDRLALALEATGPEAVASLRAELATVQEMTKQLRLSKEIQGDAQEMSRRAEFGLGKAIRKGQEVGSIRSADDTHSAGVDNRVAQANPVKPSPYSFAPKNALHNTHGGIFDLVDGVSTEQFEGALAEARAEENPSRANVIRKIRGEAPMSSRPEVLRKTRRLDSNRIVEQTVLAIGGIDSLFGQIDFSELDRALIPEWISSLSEVTRALRSLRNNLEKELNR
jgi:hypothetical protein